MPGSTSKLSSDNQTDDALSQYRRIGGEAGVRALVERFYHYMDTLPEAREIRALHADDLTETSEKLVEYFTGWFGGPPVYISKYGHPRLRARHLHVPIGERERDQWLLCMRLALDETISDPGLRRELYDRMAPLADHMRNQPG